LHDRGNGNIYTAGNNHNRLPDGQQSQGRSLAQDVEKIIYFEELGGENRGHYQHSHQEDIYNMVP
jgi:hypothetical protein